MARRSFRVIDVIKIYEHWNAGRAKVVIAESLGVDPKTVRKYVRLAEEAGLTPGGQQLTRAEWAELVNRWCPELTDPRQRRHTHR